ISKGFIQNDANIASSTVWVGLALGAPLMAWLSNKMHSRVKVLSLSLLGQAFFIGLLIILPVKDVMLATILFFCFGLFVGGSILLLVLN
ncbi:MAG: hypothetical protein ACK5MJ_07065, partial [Alphaproteobacteria bacterium]